MRRRFGHRRRRDGWPRPEDGDEGRGGGARGLREAAGGRDREGAGDHGRRPRAGWEAAGTSTAATALLRAGDAGVGVACDDQAAGRRGGGEVEVLPQFGLRDPDFQGGHPRRIQQGAQLRYLQVSALLVQTSHNQTMHTSFLYSDKPNLQTVC